MDMKQLSLIILLLLGCGKPTAIEPEAQVSEQSEFYCGHVTGTADLRMDWFEPQMDRAEMRAELDSLLWYWRTGDQARYGMFLMRRDSSLVLGLEEGTADWALRGITTVARDTVLYSGWIYSRPSLVVATFSGTITLR